MAFLSDIIAVSRVLLPQHSLLVFCVFKIGLVVSFVTPTMYGGEFSEENDFDLFLSFN